MNINAEDETFFLIVILWDIETPKPISIIV